MIARVHPRPASLHVGYGWCGWCGTAFHHNAAKHSCPGWTEFQTGKAVAPVAKVEGRQAGRSLYRAVRTTCTLGHSHPSKTEARACPIVHDRYASECAEWGYRIYIHARLPLWSLPPNDKGGLHFINVDFAIYAPHEATEIGFGVKSAGALVAMIDAKSGKRSPEWQRGRAAAQATYGIPVEELEA